jgi:hypothetical protein
MEIVIDTEREPSMNARFVSLVTAFGLWLRNENSAIIDDALVLGLAREISGGTDSERQYEFLGLVDSAIKLKGRNLPNNY